MPVLGGLEATQEIRRLEKTVGVEEQATVPILALTANALEETHQILAAGCNDILSKPFKEATLLEKMGQWLGACYNFHLDVIIDLTAALLEDPATSTASNAIAM